MLQTRICHTRASGLPRRHRQRCVAVRAAQSVIKLDSGAWAVAPTYRAKGVVHFVGGAFAGAAPQVLYSLLLDAVAAAGYTAIATPYAVTFRHDDCARALRQQFTDSLQELRAGGQDHLAPPDAPTFGLGHSNGALMHLLIGSFYPGCVDSNIVLSFNNKQVKDAIPIPGLMESLPSAMQAARASADSLPLPINLQQVQLPTGSQLLNTAASFLPPDLRRGLDQNGQLAGVGMMLDQLGSVFTEVGDGATDFYPSPAESRSIIASQYGVSPTLVVRFADDSIDESAEIVRLLRQGQRGGITDLTLPGTHITPCGGDIPWPTGAAFTPADVLVQAAKEQQQQDIQRLCRQVLGWMDSIEVRVRA